MKKRTFITVSLVLIITLSILLGQSLLSSAKPGPISGAIFTTDETGLLVDGNIYANALDVYLSGGPGPNAPPDAAGLPDGEYYFQVTDPAGKKRLSSDDIEERRFKVEGGIITQYKGTPASHNWEWVEGITGAIVIQLWPFGKTPNKGGVYKAWATPVEDYDLNNPHSFWGFIPRYSKTDNYKVRRPKPITRLILDKFNDVDNSGFYDNDDYFIEHWPIHVEDPLGVTNTYYTPRVIDVTGNPGTYTITEDLSVGWEQTAVAVDGIYAEHPGVTVTVEFKNGETHSVLYGNRKIPAKLILDKFNDANGNGVLDSGEVKILDWRITIVDPHGGTTTYLTPEVVKITEFGTYAITEDLPAGWEQTVVELDGVPQTPVKPTVTLEINEGETHNILYGNRETAPPTPPRIKIGLGIYPVIQHVGSDITFSWAIDSPSALIPVKVELKLIDPYGAETLLYWSTTFPDSFIGSKTWTATGPTGQWKARVIYYYTYRGFDLTAKATQSFIVIASNGG